MIIRSKDRQRSAAVRFGGKGEIEMVSILPPIPEAFHGKGRLFSHVVLKPGEELGSHRHDGDFEVYYYIKGEGTYNDNGKMIPVKAGDVTVCNDGEMHGITNTGKANLEYIALILFTKK